MLSIRPRQTLPTTHVPVQSGTTGCVQSDVEVGCELGYMNSDDRMAKKHDDEESDEESG